MSKNQSEVGGSLREQDPVNCFSKMGSRVTTVVALGGLISVVTFITIDRFDSEEDDQERS